LNTVNCCLQLYFILYLCYIIHVQLFVICFFVLILTRIIIIVKSNFSYWEIRFWSYCIRHLLKTYFYPYTLLFKSCSPTLGHLLGIKDWKSSVSGECKESWRCCAYKCTVLYFSPSVSQGITRHYKRIKPSAEQIRPNIFQRKKK